MAAAEPGVGDSGELQEVVVVAQKRAENSQKVPISIATVTSDQLRASGVTGSLSLITIDPSLQVQYSGGYFETRIRGVGTISNAPGVENPVALYVDGIYYASQLSGNLNLDNAEQVSILKGPQGTLFGRNATGGVIQINTRNPTQDRVVEVSEDFSTYDTSRTDAYASGGISRNVAANIFVSYATQGDGWGSNAYTQRDDVHKVNHDVSLRNKWDLTLGDATSLKLNFDYADRSDTSGLNLVPYPGTVQYAVLPGFRPSTNPWDADINQTSTTQLKSGGAAATLETGLPFGKLQNIVAYRQLHYILDFSSTAAPTPGERLTPVQASDEMTEELQLVSLDSSPVKWAAGVYYFYDSDGYPNFPIEVLPPILSPVLVPININTRIVANSAAIYGQATAPVPGLADTNVTLGARDTYERRKFKGGETVFGVPVPLPQFENTITADRPTWRASIDHLFLPNVMGYASYNRGFKSGGYNGSDPTNPPYKPEVVDAFEVGAKSELLNHTLRVNWDAFYDKYNNIQVDRYTTVAVIYNGARAKIYGAEISALARVKQLQVGIALNSLHAEFTDFPLASCSEPNIPLPGLTQFSCSATGNRLPYSPSFSGNLTADYFEDIRWGQVDFNLTEYHNGGYFTEPDNRLRQASYDYLGASITFKSSDGRYNVAVYGTNFLNRAVYSIASTNTTQYSADYENPPRLAGIRLRYRF